MISYNFSSFHSLIVPGWKSFFNLRLSNFNVFFECFKIIDFVFSPKLFEISNQIMSKILFQKMINLKRSFYDEYKKSIIKSMIKEYYKENGEENDEEHDKEHDKVLFKIDYIKLNLKSIFKIMIFGKSRTFTNLFALYHL